MSYLNLMRLHFAGKFQASVSTVNNDPKHFNNDTFKPQYQDLQHGKELNGWWNPRGDAAFRLLGVKVTSAFGVNGEAVAADDEILSCFIGDNDQTVSAKMADLDPQQQLVSGIWGLEVRIVNAAGDALLRGHFKPANFMDIWDRALQGGGDTIAGSTYQSVLTDLHWNEERLATSPFLQQLRKISPDRLSIKFNVDGFNMQFTSPDFCKGRIVGSIGPDKAGEPDFFVNGRQFIAEAAPNGNFFKPQGNINFCPAIVDEAAGKVLIDLGNALPTKTAGGAPMNLGPLSLVCEIQPKTPTGAVEWLHIGGDIPYLQPGWYEKTAGVVVLPQDCSLTADELQQIRTNPLTLLLPDSSHHLAPAITEAPGGLFVRMDAFVFRMNPGETATTRLYATQYGQPYPNARIILYSDPSQLQSGLGDNDPPMSTPLDALEYASRVVTGADGTAEFMMYGHDPKNPRTYIDGQVYGIRPQLEETMAYGFNYPMNPWNFISVLLWNEFVPYEPPTWYGEDDQRTMEWIFKQYANLYPVMDRFLNLGDYESICKNRALLEMAFKLDEQNPNAMPVTRDLSETKRQAILFWLANVGPDGKPLLGEKPLQSAEAPREDPLESAEAKAAAEFTDPRGGKTAAMQKRYINQLKKGRFQR